MYRFLPSVEMTTPFLGNWEKEGGVASLPPSFSQFTCPCDRHFEEALATEKPDISKILKKYRLTNLS